MDLTNMEGVEGNKPALIDVLIRTIHFGLGGDGWAYSNYATNELRYCADKLESAASDVLAVLRERGYLTPEAIEQLKKEGL